MTSVQKLQHIGTHSFVPISEDEHGEDAMLMERVQTGISFEGKFTSKAKAKIAQVTTEYTRATVSICRQFLTPINHNSSITARNADGM